MLSKHSETFFGVDSEYDDARIVIFGAPFDSTTSFRPGARFGSRTMRAESFGLESYSPYLDSDVSDALIFDSGDLELPFGDTRAALDAIEERASAILHGGKKPLMLGGEHLVTLGAVTAAVKKYPGLHVVHFDAHTDLRDEYLGAALSHATVIRRCHDILGDGKIHQYGIRSGERAEFEWAKAHSQLTKFDFSGLERLKARLNGTPVYFTLDLDVLDPSVLPGTGTPEACGVSARELMAALKLVFELNVVGCDICELAPVYDPSGASTATANKLLREMLLLWK